MNKLSILLTTALLALVSFTACVKKDFSSPPDTSKDDPNLPVNATIRQLKALNGIYNYQTGGDTTVITDDVLVSGIVTADDRSGNFYKRINVEDSSGGIQLLIDQYSLYADYPVGRKIYIRCKGLTLGYEGGSPVIGMGVDETMAVQGIGGGKLDEHVVKGPVGNTVTPIVVRVAQLQYSNYDPQLINRLITVEGVQFRQPFYPYAQPTGTTNRDLADTLSKVLLTVRTSNYSNFAAYPIPNGKGSVTGIFTLYTGSTGSKYTQLIIRDTNDVKIPTLPLPPSISIDSLRRMYKGSAILLGNNISIHGTVISDASYGNVTAGNVVIQDGARGTVIYFGSTAPAFNVGDSILIDISGDSLTTFRGSSELKVLSGSAAKVVARNRTVVPRVMTAAEVAAKYNEVEWTLVRINNATSATGGTYAGSKTITDATGGITLFTSTTAAFASQQMPKTPANYTGIISKFNTTLQIQPRNLADVSLP